MDFARIPATVGDPLNASSLSTSSFVSPGNTSVVLSCLSPIPSLTVQQISPHAIAECRLVPRRDAPMTVQRLASVLRALTSYTSVRSSANIHGDSSILSWSEYFAHFFQSSTYVHCRKNPQRTGNISRNSIFISPFGYNFSATVFRFDTEVHKAMIISLKSSSRTEIATLFGFMRYEAPTSSVQAMCPEPLIA